MLTLTVKCRSFDEGDNECILAYVVARAAIFTGAPIVSRRSKWMCCVSYFGPNSCKTGFNARRPRCDTRTKPYVRLDATEGYYALQTQFETQLQ